ncbi:Iron-regulated ABC transporter permease protein SufD [Pilibacter termitis]|uniref:Iron-regulated ABC transporter permease protein SufD n=1 Tax=Pilibacter termitis TaxID=263852 RepID=A0A1T4KHQ6_9ENTE|nr:Fe-S cluster assembly protein SufD [Pilibacter termitis]SJZ41958.1 Iron-regulated ABC transporter permease protein SufD [Pilibacter termitis]
MSEKERIVDFSLMKEEPAFMQTLRQNSLELIDTLEFPKIERVNYTRWNLFSDTFDKEEEMTNSVPSFEAMRDNAALVQVGTQTLMEQLPQDLIEKGVVLTDIFTAMTEYPELVEKYYMTSVKPDEDKMSAHHATYMNSGVFLYVPKEVKIDEPIELTLFQNSESDVAFNKHILIVADTHSEFTYIEKLQTIGNGNERVTANVLVEVVALDGAKIKYSAIDRLGENVVSFIARRGHLKENAEIDWAVGVMNDGLTAYDLDSDLIGNASHADMKVVAISSGRQVQGIDTRVTNYGHHSIGNILQHGVILDRSSLTFNGIGHIIKGAKFADAQQESRVLMLSDKARGDANPILLIDENEVTAGHAASIGRVDPDDMYYLMSRGIEPKEAQRLVIRGFLGAVITAMPSRTLQEEFIEMIERKLSAL